jgi:hypothetical protein
MGNNPMATWKELSEQGVKRCSVMFKNGKQCRCRADEDEYGGSWCRKHGPVMTMWLSYSINILNRTNGKQSNDNRS